MDEFLSLDAGLRPEQLGSHHQLVRAYKVLRSALADIAKYGPSTKACRADARNALLRAQACLVRQPNDAA